MVLLWFICICSSLAALGLIENSATNIVAAMLVSPLMGPVMAITFGTIISDRQLVVSKRHFSKIMISVLFALPFHSIHIPHYLEHKQFLNNFSLLYSLQ